MAQYVAAIGRREGDIKEMVRTHAASPSCLFLLKMSCTTSSRVSSRALACAQRNVIMSDEKLSLSSSSCVSSSRPVAGASLRSCAGACCGGR